RVCTEYAVCNGRIEPGSAFCYRPDCQRQLAYLRSLYAVAIRPGAEGCKHSLIVPMDCQHDNANFAALLLDLLGRCDTIQQGHAYIHQNDVRLNLHSLLYSDSPVTGFADDGETFYRLKNSSKALPCDLLIINNEDPDVICSQCPRSDGFYDPFYKMRRLLSSTNNSSMLSQPPGFSVYAHKGPGIVTDGIAEGTSIRRGPTGHMERSSLAVVPALIVALLQAEAFSSPQATDARPASKQREDQHREALLNSANSLSARGKYAEAAAIYRRLVTASKPKARVFHMYGRTLALMRKFEEAAVQYRKALALA